MLRRQRTENRRQTLKDRAQKTENKKQTSIRKIFISFRVCLLTSVFCALSSMILISGCATVSVEEQKKAEFHYKMGISYFNEGNIQMAFVEFQKAYQIDPNNKDILNSLGLVYLQFEEFDKARDLFLKAVFIDSSFSEAYNNLGVTYLRRRQWEEAIDAFKKALSNPLYQTPERAFYNLGISYYRIRQYEPSINAFKDAIKRSPLFPMPYYGLALVYNKEGMYGDAAAIIARAIEIDPEYRGDRKKFIEDIKQKLITAKDEEEADLRDYLEIMRY